VIRSILFLSVLGCNGKNDDTAQPATDDWSLLADGVGSGVLLSAWSERDIAISVGGDMDGGPGMIARYDGSTLCTEDAVTERALWWIHGPAEGEWWAVGEAGTILHSAGGARTREDVETEATLYGVWADGESVWAVGGDVSAGTGEIWRRSEGTWAAVERDLPGVVFKVWDGWFVGDHLGYQLVDDTLQPVTLDERALTVRGRDSGDVWAVGGEASARVLHVEDGAWVERDATGLGQPLNGVWTAPDEPLWITGNFGTTAWWDDTTETWQMPDLPVTSDHFHAVWKHGEDVLFFGGNLMSQGSNYGTIGRYGVNSEPLVATACE